MFDTSQLQLEVETATAENIHVIIFLLYMLQVFYKPDLEAYSIALWTELSESTIKHSN